ncbi:MAG: glucose-6-phosphate isomerase [Rhodospirillaceae bacterium]
MTVPDPKKTKAWAVLTQHNQAMENVLLRNLFDQDSKRFNKFSWSHAGLTVDLSKQRLSDETLPLLLDLAETMQVADRRNAMFAGQPVNTTENRAALHVALRDPTDRAYFVNGEDVALQIKYARGRMLAFVKQVISGARTGHTGQAFDRVVNIGIGGSDLGPRCAVTALSDHSTSPLKVDFVATVDGTALQDVLAYADPHRTLFLICSKSFSTLETMTNAQEARRWLVAALGETAVADHFIALTAANSAAGIFGIPETNVFPLWDWVGGRYSLWSAIGLSIALGCGPEVFERILAGAHAMDRHFETAPLAENIPVLMGLVSVWNQDFWTASALSVLPYDHRLRLVPAHFQQLLMESNGKGVRADGKPVSARTAPIVFGGSGAESQHSFMQQIHQSPKVVPVEFIVALDGQGDPHRDILVANAFAQSEALMRGLLEDEIPRDSAKSAVPYKVCPGNRPSTTILLESLIPETFGALIALYEHRTFVEGTLWGLNPFDQWGVEFGKALASKLMTSLETGHVAAGHDSSTAGLLSAYLAQRGQNRTLPS